MTFLDSALAANDEVFRLRVAACCFKLAQDVINESRPEPDADEHATYVLRRNLALLAVNAPQIVADRFVWLCAANPSIAGSVTVTDDDLVEVTAPDGDIEFVCASNWTVIASRDAG